MKLHPVPQINTEASPREILTNDFESGELPINGGWGYSIETACVIDKNDPIVDPSLPFSGVRIEKDFVDMRIIEELRLYTGGEEFRDIDRKLLRQDLIQENDKIYDCLQYEITANSKTGKIKFPGKFYFDITSFIDEY